MRITNSPVELEQNLINLFHLKIYEHQGTSNLFSILNKQNQELHLSVEDMWNSVVDDEFEVQTPNFKWSLTSEGMVVTRRSCDEADCDSNLDGFGFSKNSPFRILQ